MFSKDKKEAEKKVNSENAQKHNEDASKKHSETSTETSESKEVIEKKDEQKKHEDEINNLMQKLIEKDLKIFKLENEIKALNEQYTKKVTEKAIEAQKLVDQKISEYQTKFNHEINEAKKYAFVKDGAKLIEVLNNFDMVLSHSNHAGEAVKNYAAGFQVVHSLFKKLLSDLHIHEIRIKVNDVFDSNTMEAFEEVENADVKSGHVAQVIKKGYKLHDKVLSFALVKIAK